MNEWSTRLRLWVIDQDTYPIHILRYEDLKRDTVVEVENTLNFLNVSFNVDTLKRRLREDYSEFQRPHSRDDFEHFSPEQKQFLRSVLLDVNEAAERAGKSHLLRLNEYLSTINTSSPSLNAVLIL